jgi:hypothetical protein
MRRAIPEGCSTPLGASSASAMSSPLSEERSTIASDDGAPGCPPAATTSALPTSLPASGRRPATMTERVAPPSRSSPGSSSSGERSTSSDASSATSGTTKDESSRSPSRPSSPPTTPTTTGLAEVLYRLSPTARETAVSIGQLLVWGYTPREAADALGIALEQVLRRLAELQDEIEQLAGIASTDTRCAKCGEVAKPPLRGMCKPCARNRPCALCGRLAVLSKNLCPDCFPVHTHPCVDCGKVTRMRPRGRCSPCEAKARRAAEDVFDEPFPL